jgi:outer membrane protein TolC
MAEVTIPLYRAGTDYSKTRQAVQTATQRGLELDDTRNKARENAANGWQSLMTAREAIKGRKEVVTAETEALAGVREEAKVGTRTVPDVLNAEQELLDARINLVKVEHDEEMAILQLRSAIGALTADALRLSVAVYDPTAHYKDVRDKWFGFGSARQTSDMAGGKTDGNADSKP